MSANLPADAALSRAQREAICEVGRRLYARGLVAGAEGNISVRLPGGRILATPAGAGKGDLTPEMLVELSPAGELLPPPARGGGVERATVPVSTEIRMHLRIYTRRPDVNAVVHAHPPIATGFAVAGEDLMAPVHPEVIMQLGGVPLVPYATPGTEALAEAMEPFLPAHDAFLLANHGATTIGPTLAVAHHRMESLEQCARIVLAARTLGRVTLLTDTDVAPLQAARAAMRDRSRLRAGEE